MKRGKVRMSTPHIVEKNCLSRAFQLTAELEIKYDEERAVKYNAGLIYDWIKKKFPAMGLDDNLHNTLKQKAGNRIDILYDYGKYFCASIEHLDTKVPGRIWITECEIISANGKYIFGTKVSYTTPESAEMKDEIFSIPSFVIDIARKNGFRDVRILNQDVFEANSMEKIKELRDLIVNEDRKFPLVVITDMEDDETTKERFHPLIKPYLLIGSIGIISHIAHIPYKMTQVWNECMGDFWGAYNGAIRIYYSNTDLEGTDYFLHPLATAKRIRAEGYIDEHGKEHKGEDVFHELLIDKIKSSNIRMRINWCGCGHKFSGVAHAEKFRDYRKTFANIKDMEKYYEEEIERLERGIKEAEDEAYSAMQEATAIEKKLKEALENIKAQNYRIDSLEELAIKRSSNEQDVIEIPEKYEDIPEWVQKHFAGRLVLAPRAKSALKSAIYEDVSTVCKSLMMLAKEYYQMRCEDLRGSTSRMDFFGKCQELGVQESASVSDICAGEEGETYNLNYGGKKRKLDRHLKKGSSRDPRYCMRIYYFWDEEMCRTVIGYLPGHLDNRMT
jgi:hypothetical protein